jgi:preprotein translocase subunit SecE
MKKVITPSRAEVQTTTIVVIATVFLFAVFFAIVDFFVGHGIDLVFTHLTKS